MTNSSPDNWVERQGIVVFVKKGNIEDQNVLIATVNGPVEAIVPRDCDVGKIVPYFSNGEISSIKEPVMWEHPSRYELTVTEICGTFVVTFKIAPDRGFAFEDYAIFLGNIILNNILVPKTSDFVRGEEIQIIAAYMDVSALYSDCYFVGLAWIDSKGGWRPFHLNNILDKSQVLFANDIYETYTRKVRPNRLTAGFRASTKSAAQPKSSNRRIDRSDMPGTSKQTAQWEQNPDELATPNEPGISMDWTNKPEQSKKSEPSAVPNSESADGDETDYLNDFATKKPPPKKTEKAPSNEHLQIKSEIGRKFHADLIEGAEEPQYILPRMTSVLNYVAKHGSQSRKTVKEPSNQSIQQKIPLEHPKAIKLNGRGLHKNLFEPVQIGEPQFDDSQFANKMGNMRRPGQPGDDFSARMSQRETFCPAKHKRVNIKDEDDAFNFVAPAEQEDYSAQQGYIVEEPESPGEQAHNHRITGQEDQPKTQRHNQPMHHERRSERVEASIREPLQPTYNEAPQNWKGSSSRQQPNYEDGYGQQEQQFRSQQSRSQQNSNLPNRDEFQYFNNHSPYNRQSQGHYKPDRRPMPPPQQDYPQNRYNERPYNNDYDRSYQEGRNSRDFNQPSSQNRRQPSQNDYYDSAQDQRYPEPSPHPNSRQQYDETQRDPLPSNLTAAEAKVFWDKMDYVRQTEGPEAALRLLFSSRNFSQRAIEAPSAQQFTRQRPTQSYQNEQEFEDQDYRDDRRQYSNQRSTYRGQWDNSEEQSYAQRNDSRGNSQRYPDQFEQSRQSQGYDERGYSNGGPRQTDQFDNRYDTRSQRYPDYHESYVDPRQSRPQPEQPTQPSAFSTYPSRRYDYLQHMPPRFFGNNAQQQRPTAEMDNEAAPVYQGSRRQQFVPPQKVLNANPDEYIEMMNKVRAPTRPAQQQPVNEPPKVERVIEPEFEPEVPPRRQELHRDMSAPTNGFQPVSVRRQRETQPPANPDNFMPMSDVRKKLPANSVVKPQPNSKYTNPGFSNESEDPSSDEDSLKKLAASKRSNGTAKDSRSRYSHPRSPEPVNDSRGQYARPAARQVPTASTSQAKHTEKPPATNYRKIDVYASGSEDESEVDPDDDVGRVMRKP